MGNKQGCEESQNNKIMLEFWSSECMLISKWGHTIVSYVVRNTQEKIKTWKASRRIITRS